MTKNDQINSLINQIGDLIKKQSDQVLWEDPDMKVFINGRRVDIDYTEYKDGELIIYCDEETGF